MDLNNNNNNTKFVYGCVTLAILYFWINMFSINPKSELNMAKIFLGVPLPTEANCTFFKSGSRNSKSAISAEFTYSKKEISHIQKILLKKGWTKDKQIIGENNEKYYFFSKDNYEYVLVDYDNLLVWEESFYEK